MTRLRHYGQKSIPMRIYHALLTQKVAGLQNTNDPPWTTTYPIAIKADNYPPYMAPRDP